MKMRSNDGERDLLKCDMTVLFIVIADWLKLLLSLGVKRAQMTPPSMSRTIENSC